jgi:lipid A 3-O-deacylase
LRSIIKNSKLLIIVIMLSLGVTPVLSGTKSYDIESLLFEPHPFITELNRKSGFVISAGQQAIEKSKLTSQLNTTRKKQNPSSGGYKRPVKYILNSVSKNRMSYLQFGTGYYDINDNKSTFELRVEKRFAKAFLKLQPLTGLMITGDKAIYGYGGISLDWVFGNFILTPSFAAGLYLDGDGKDLGHAIEFRSALEVSYQFKNRHRLGLMIYHLSNASLSDNNPGTEVLSLGYSVPFSW